MIIDITETFYQYAASSRTAHTQSNWHASTFIKHSNSYLSDLTLLDSKLADLEKMIRSGARFDKEAQANKIVNVKEHLKLCQQNIKRLKSQNLDIKSRKLMAQKFKQSVLIAMQLKLLTATFKFKDIHLGFAKKTNSNKQAFENTSERQINLSKSHFLEPTQNEMLQQVASQEYKQIQKSISEISSMYQETMIVVRMHELLIDNIESYIDVTDQNVERGKGNLSEVSSKQQKNRRFIYKVFALLYFIVFVYIVILS